MYETKRLFVLSFYAYCKSLLRVLLDQTSPKSTSQNTIKNSLTEDFNDGWLVVPSLQQPKFYAIKEKNINVADELVLAQKDTPTRLIPVLKEGETVTLLIQEDSYFRKNTEFVLLFAQ